MYVWYGAYGTRPAVAVTHVDDDRGALEGGLDLGPRRRRRVDADDVGGVLRGFDGGRLGVAPVGRGRAGDRADDDHDLGVGRRCSGRSASIPPRPARRGPRRGSRWRGSWRRASATVGSPSGFGHAVSACRASLAVGRRHLNRGMVPRRAGPFGVGGVAAVGMGGVWGRRTRRASAGRPTEAARRRTGRVQPRSVATSSASVGFDAIAVGQDRPAVGGREIGRPRNAGRRIVPGEAELVRCRRTRRSRGRGVRAARGRGSRGRHRPG